MLICSFSIPRVVLLTYACLCVFVRIYAAWGPATGASTRAPVAVKLLAHPIAAGMCERISGLLFTFVNVNTSVNTSTLTFACENA